ncbi:MAG: hypothetical protein KDA97_01740 [Acidimicrobiales bacterium]|nr:hypothetical protein [Acidimicrobiales bacterium]
MEHVPVADRTPAAASPEAEPAAPGAEAEARCPFPHAIADALPGCPVPHDRAAGAPAPQRSKADLLVRRVLRIPERPAGVSAAQANRSFQTSMLISATRCTLTYVVFPILIPLIGIAKGVEAPLGIAIGTFAIVCDVFTIRRFFAADHKYRWWFSAIALSIIGLLFILLAEDIFALVT